MTVNLIDLWQAVAWNQLILVAESTRCNMAVLLNLLNFGWIVSHNTDKALKLPFYDVTKQKSPLMAFRDVCPSVESKDTFTTHQCVQINCHLKSPSVTVLHHVAHFLDKIIPFFCHGLPFTVLQTINHYCKPLLQTLLSAMCCLRVNK